MYATTLFKVLIKGFFHLLGGVWFIFNEYRLSIFINDKDSLEGKTTLNDNALSCKAIAHEEVFV